MLDRLELVERPAADALRRRVRGQPLRMCGLDAAQLVDELVVLGIRDLGVVEDVIAVPVVLQLPAQLGGSLRGRVSQSCVRLVGANGRSRTQTAFPCRRRRSGRSESA